jgi:hypothetical protein
MADSLSSTLSPDSHLTADGDLLEMSVTGMGGVAIQVQGTFTATISFEGTVNGGAWAALRVCPIGTSVSATSASAAGIWFACCVGLLKVRARVSSYSDGSARVVMQAVVSAPWGAIT